MDQVSGSERKRSPPTPSIFESVERKKYVCPMYKESFGGPYKVWEHAKPEHKDALRNLDSSNEETVKEKFLQNALVDRGYDSWVPAKDGKFTPNISSEGSATMEVDWAAPEKSTNVVSPTPNLKLFDPETYNPLKRRPHFATERSSHASRSNRSHARVATAKTELFESKTNNSHAKRPHSAPEAQFQHGVTRSAGLDNRKQTLSGLKPTPDKLQDHGIPYAFQNHQEPGFEMLRQPQTRPISHDQLVVEVKGIYVGLVMVEAKCIDVDEKQSIRAQEDPSRRDPLNNDQWQYLIALHKQLLHKHHDFFLASQHPSVSSNLSKLAAKYSMPARMWRHGIHAFLEVLRHRLPESLEHMLAFIYIAYSMMALLYETVSIFEDTWIECLGDLGRYRMAIEDDEPKDREVWSGVARFWYSKAAAKIPTVGRLYHHLAILARPYTLEQLSFYTRSLTYVTPFESDRGSIMTLFNPILSSREVGCHRSLSMDSFNFKVHGKFSLFVKRYLEVLNDGFDQLDEGSVVEYHIEVAFSGFKGKGTFLAVSDIAALSEFGALTTKDIYRSIPRRSFDQCKARTRMTAESTVFPGDKKRETELSSPPKSPVKSKMWLGSSTKDETPPVFGRLQSGKQMNRLFNFLTSVTRIMLPQKLIGYLTLPMLFSQAVAALPPPANDSIAGKNDAVFSSVKYLADMTLLILIFLVLGAAQLLVSLKRSPIPVWSTLMATYAFGWWCIRNDATTSLGLSWSVFIGWLISSIHYSAHAFHKPSTPPYTPLVVIVVAVVFDLLLVRMMTPPEAALSQTDLLNLSLPSASLSLGIAAIAVKAYRERYPGRFYERNSLEGGFLLQEMP